MRLKRYLYNDNLCHNIHDKWQMFLGRVLFSARDFSRQYCRLPLSLVVNRNFLEKINHWYCYSKKGAVDKCEGEKIILDKILVEEVNLHLIVNRNIQDVLNGDVNTFYLIDVSEVKYNEYVFDLKVLPQEKNPFSNINNKAFNVIDEDTNMLYLSDLLEKQYPDFYNDFTKVLRQENVPVKIIPYTKSIWARDYMPVQVGVGSFVKFTYAPNYLLKYKKYQSTITTHAGIILKVLGYEADKKSALIIDGGNIVKSRTRAILTSKIFNDNPEFSEYDIISKLERLLRVEVIIVPWDRSDIFGHADGLVRFIDEYTVLVNDRMLHNNVTYDNFIAPLLNARLKIEKMITGSMSKTSSIDATGLYLNYLEIGNKLFIPVYNMADDDRALKRFQKLFPHKKIIPVVSNGIAKDGGLLNCISWNILRYGTTKIINPTWLTPIIKQKKTTYLGT